MKQQHNAHNPNQNPQIIHEDGLQQVRLGFKALIDTFTRDVTYWQNAGPVAGDESRRLAVSELAQILDDKKLFEPVEAHPSKDKALHDLRSSIALITNGIALLGLVEAGPERDKLVQLITRSLERLAVVTDNICNEVELWPHPEKMIAFLLHSSERLSKLIAYENIDSKDQV